jgi:signal transduction histidine kinase/DNA-binding NarL/FixJ family response regulator
MPVDPFVAPPTAPAPPVGRRRGSALEAPALLAIGLVVTAAVADPELARDVVALGGVLAALAILLRRLRPEAAPPVAPRDEDTAGTEARGRLLALAAHELRTPLTGILGLADLLAETSLTAEQTAYVRALRGSGASLLRLVDGYLDLSRLDAGRVEPTPVATSLETVIEDVVELLAPSCQAKGLEIAGHVAPALAGTVAVDPLLLRQVLINLVGNAVKFTETGGVAVEVERPAGGGDTVCFRVRDTGIGIAPEAASRIFDAWERVEDDPAARAGGTGLGLAIARGIVERMGGRIELASRPGEGSTFSFRLDLPPVAPPPPAERPLRGRRVAVVSGAAIEPPLLVRRLHALGAEAWLVRAAADLGPADAFDVVLVDRFADADAGADLATLRATGVMAPAVVLIPPDRRAELPALRAAGFAAHLVRPVRAASLARVVALAVGASPVGPTAAPADVLLVDDNEINALLGRAAVEHAGHRVVVEHDGAAGLAAIEAARAAGHPFAAVLMDLHMPGLDGFAAIRALRAAEPAEGPRARVVALTADTTPTAAAAALAAGADATMVKPIDRDRLARLLAEAPRPGADGRLSA